MFSDHLKKVDEMPARALLGVAAGLVFFCQLVALVLVVDGQVEKAYLREAHDNSAQIAIADCSDNYSGSARSQCIERANAALNPASTFTPEPQAQAISRGAGQSEASPLASNVPGFMQTTFARRQ
jgi:hypothetical protein